MGVQIAEKRHLFGTSGVRGVVGDDLTTDLCRGIGRALGSSLAPHSGVCVATDARHSRGLVQQAVVSGLLSTGMDVVGLGILPTPALALLTRELGFSAGVMLTASHNPPQYNGIKLFNADSSGYSLAQETGIESIYFSGRFRDGAGTFDREDDTRERYLSFLRDRLRPSEVNRNLKVVVDPGNGAASVFAGYIFASMGVDVIPLNDYPDGGFPGRSPEPNEDTLQGTIEFLRQRGADMAVCFDGDGDRVVFCDEEGFLGLDSMVAYISRLRIDESGKRKVATTVETGRLLDLAVQDLGVEVLRGEVGDVKVAHLARQADAALGVEGVGVYIFPELGYYPDSIFAALTLLGHLEHPRQLREFFRSLPALSLEKAKLPCPNGLKDMVMTRLNSCVAELSSDDGFHRSGKERRPHSVRPMLNCVDGLRLETPDAWLLIRPSGTEPAIRVIAEAASPGQAHGLLARGKELVETILRMDTPSPVPSPGGDEVGPEARYRPPEQKPEAAPR